MIEKCNDLPQDSRTIQGHSPGLSPHARSPYPGENVALLFQCLKDTQNNRTVTWSIVFQTVARISPMHHEINVWLVPYF